MSPQARENTCHNTAKYLNFVQFPEIQTDYLAQIYNISPDYAQGVFDRLREQKFTMEEIKAKAEDAHTWYREKKFLSSDDSN
ncbi:hypothetical protein HYQ45_002429 [Verticillium longisporum]|uniref:Catalase immune-responsive domain-containing protein n=1 Tax=Verticillium longisporum TaxID=100787 RepID=A0A0G4LWX5_VERLO|nr:hypothetical protein HYQ44_001084 [Verticillium longisporum]KAG7129802.1 hypothetical protein HYQ46_010091 [Verticillium longisporum]KAG7140712.1 hypothetical protein HYQ45_002429 [Verticillium longisporum]CRK26578.1 hypothetical protein BN1708_014576 [Verticillium longisporum]